MDAEINHRPSVARREERARIFAALGDPTRLGVMDLLAVQDLSPDVLAAALEVPGNLLAHHLKVLEAAGLVRRVHSHHDRRRTYVQAIPDATADMMAESSGWEATRVVFVCTHNSARSVLAEALWREASDVPTASAGTHPAHRVNPGAARAAKRFGLTLNDHGPRRIDDVIRPGDLIVSVCDSVNEEFTSTDNPRIHWSIPDPAEVGTQDAFDHAVDDIRDRVTHLASRVRCQTIPRSRRSRS